MDWLDGKSLIRVAGTYPAGINRSLSFTSAAIETEARRNPSSRLRAQRGQAIRQIPVIGGSFRRRGYAIKFGLCGALCGCDPLPANAHARVLNEITGHLWAARARKQRCAGEAPLRAHAHTPKSARPCFACSHAGTHARGDFSAEGALTSAPAQGCARPHKDGARGCACNVRSRGARPPARLCFEDAALPDDSAAQNSSFFSGGSS